MKFNLTSLSGDSYNNQNTNTNSGYFMFSPRSFDDPFTNNDPRTIIKNGKVTTSDGSEVLVGLAGSVDKANNSPAPITCGANYSGVSSNYEYKCSVDIELPLPQGDIYRDPDNSFIRLTTPSIEMTVDIPFEISYHKKDTSGNPGSVIKMDRTQYLVSVNGKTGERVRRTEAYIGGISNDAMIPLWSATVGGGGITKCDDRSTQKASQSTDDCNDNGKLTDAVIKRNYSNYSDFYICEHTYYEGVVANDDGPEDTHWIPNAICNNR